MKISDFNHFQAFLQIFPIRKVGNITIFLIMLYLSLQIYPLLSFLPGTDEGFYGNPARNLVYAGNLAASLYFPEFGFDHYAFYVFPTFTLLQAVAALLFGFDLYVLRGLMLLVSLGFLLFLYRFSKRLSMSKIAAVCTLLFVTLSMSFLRIARTVRPEIILLMFLFGSLHFFVKSKEDLPWHWQKNLFLSGLFAGLGIITHPIGCLVPLNTLIFLLNSRKQAEFIKLLLNFFFGIFLILSAVIVYYKLTDSGMFFDQMRFLSNTYSLRVSSLTVSSQIVQWFHAIFTYYGGYRLPEILTLVVLSSLVIWKAESSLRRPILKCLGINLFFLMFIYPNKFIDYSLIFTLPYLFILSGQFLSKILEGDVQSKMKKRFLGLLMVALYVIFNLGAGIFNTYRGMQFGFFTDFRRALRQFIPERDKDKLCLLGNAQYLYSFPESRLLEVEVLRDMVEFGKSSSWREALRTIRPHYIIVDDYFMGLGDGWPLWPAFTDRATIANFLQKKAHPLGSVEWANRSITVYSLNTDFDT